MKYPVRLSAIRESISLRRITMVMLSRLVLILIMPFALSGTILCWAGDKMPGWYNAAREFVETSIRLTAPNANALELLKAQEANVEKLRGIPSPPVKELNQLIQSPRMEERETALATAMVLRRTDSSLVKTIMVNYEQEQGFWAKFYSQQVLANITPSQLKEMEEQLFKILQREPDEPIIIAGLQTVERLERGKRIELFVQYMTRGSEGLQRVCAVHLRKVGKPDIDVVTSALRKRNATRALGYLEQFRGE